jgi:hypothetical protein
LRLWQLSQQAVAGMLAGLLKQPRTRRGTGAASWLPPEEDPMQLKRRVAQLERELKLAEELIALLRELPGNKDRVKDEDAKRPRRAAKKKPKRKARRRPATQGEKKSPEGEQGAFSADDGPAAG